MHSTSITTSNGTRTEHIFYTTCSIVKGLPTTSPSFSTSLSTYYASEYHSGYKPLQTGDMVVVHYVTDLKSEASCASYFDCWKPVDPDPDIAGLGVRLLSCTQSIFGY